MKKLILTLVIFVQILSAMGQISSSLSKNESIQQTQTIDFKTGSKMKSIQAGGNESMTCSCCKVVFTGTTFGDDLGHIKTCCKKTENPKVYKLSMEQNLFELSKVRCLVCGKRHKLGNCKDKYVDAVNLKVLAAKEPLKCKNGSIDINGVCVAINQLVIVTCNEQNKMVVAHLDTKSGEIDWVVTTSKTCDFMGERVFSDNILKN
jgi:hypothetical protein